MKQFVVMVDLEVRENKIKFWSEGNPERLCRDR